MEPQQRRRMGMSCQPDSNMSSGPEVQYVPHHEDQDGFAPVRTYGPGYFEKKACMSGEESMMYQAKGQVDVGRTEANNGAKAPMTPHRNGNNNIADYMTLQPQQPQDSTKRRQQLEPEEPDPLDPSNLPSIILTQPTEMGQPEHHFNVFIRMPYKRGDFVDPPPVAWNSTKEHALWDILSRVAKNSETDWKSLAEQFEVTPTFLLQQAAWLYERNLQQVRAHMRRIGNSRQSTTPSPAPGSTSASMVGGQAMRRAGSGGSRVPSRLSTQALGSPTVGAGGDSTPGTPAKSRASLPMRNASGIANTGPSQPRTASGTTRPLSRQSSKEAESTAGHVATQSRRGSLQHMTSRSPGQARTAGQPQQQVPPQSSDSEEEMTQSRMITRRVNPSLPAHRRIGLAMRKDSQSLRGNTASPIDLSAAAPHQDSDDDEDEDSPSFLPFATPNSQPNSVEPKPRPSSSSQQDPSATLRGGFAHLPGPVQTQNLRPNIHRRTTSERISSPTVEPPTPKPDRDITSSTSSLSSPTTQSHPSATATYATARTNQSNVSNNLPRQAQASQASSRPSNQNPLSPPHRALLPSSPRRHPTGAGSDTSPSMGSSFSDLDDASVTQSALEEALLSGMGNTTMTVHGGVAGRVSGISQALRSRYFDSRGNERGNGISER